MVFCQKKPKEKERICAVYIGRLQLWRIHYKNMFGEINFGEFEIPFKNFNTVLWLDFYSFRKID